MTNTEFESLSEIDDVMTVGIVEDLIDAGTVDSFEEVRTAVNYRSRDHARTPMQWAADDRADFTEGDPWLPVNDNYTDINVERAREDTESVWHHYRRLIELRRDDPALVYGDYELLAPEDEQIYAYTRQRDGERRLVVCNWSAEPAAFASDAVAPSDAEVLIGNYDDAPTDPVDAEFRPFEAVVYAY